MAQLSLTMAVAAALLVVGQSMGGRLSYRKTGTCQPTLQGVANIYKYRSTQSQFDGDNKETTEVSARVTIFCISGIQRSSLYSAGEFGDQKAQLFGMKITNTHVGGKLFEKDAADRILDAELQRVDPEKQGKAVTSFDDMMDGWFRYAQTDDGAIRAVYHSKEEDAGSINFKKRICASMQANFKGTASRKEADPTSSHVARYTNAASMEGVTEQGTVRQHRVVDSDDVSNYASHIEPDQIKSRSEDDIEYKQGVLLTASGTSTISILPEVHVSPGEDVEADVLEADTDSGGRKRRQVYTEGISKPTYDEGTKMNHFEASGSFTLTRVRQEQMARSRRDTEEYLELPEVVESSLLAFINYTSVGLDYMKDIHSELGSIISTLQYLHKNVENDEDAIAHKLRDLLELEAKYGPLTGYTPAINDVLDYLQQLQHSEKKEDIAMRASIYFMISPEGSLNSQKALLEALDSETTEEEHLSVIMYIAFAHNPHPQLVAQLENRIGPNVHTNTPLLLAYGCLIPKASHELQQRMTLFLLNRLPHAEMDKQSLIHHLHSLGNAGEPSSARTLTSYLQHPNENVQLTTISALRFLINETIVQEALTELLLQPDVSEEHIVNVVSSLQYGIEHAQENRVHKPYNTVLATTLAAAAIHNSNGQFDSAIINYLSTVNTPESNQLAKFLKSVQFQESSNGTRARRGTNWAERNSVYDLVEPLGVRQSDQRVYENQKSFIWGKKFGVSDGNIQFAAGGFMGVSNAGDYKIFTRAVAEGNAFGRCYRAVDFKLLRQKTQTNTHSVLYVMVAGKTLKNIDVWQPSSVCKTYDTGLFQKKTFHLFTLRHSIYIYVGTLSFKVEGSIEMTGKAFMESCENGGSATAKTGLTPTVSFKIRAGASANILALAKGFIDVTGTFNYVVSPELSTMVCYKYGTVAVQNCAGIYHQWKDNNIQLSVSYQTRTICWGECWSRKKPWKAASKSWSVAGSAKTPLWEMCDRRVSC